MGLGRARLRRCRSNDLDESRKRSVRVSNEALAMSISKIADGHPRSAGSPRRGPRARGSVSLRAGRAGRVDATRACFRGAARSASPPRRGTKSVVVVGTPETKRREDDFQRSLIVARSREKTCKMRDIDVLFIPDGTPRCAWR
jgi:hypothetical protein